MATEPGSGRGSSGSAPGARVRFPSGGSLTLRAVTTHRAVFGANGSKGSEGSKGAKGSAGDGNDSGRTVAYARALGLPEVLGRPFECLLPGHDGHDAKLVCRGNTWRYRCAEHTCELAEVRAALAYGEVRDISNIEAARWRERLAYEAGLDQPRAVPELPSDLSPLARRVGEGLLLFVGLRNDEMWDEQPFVFARRFATAYCGVTEDEARRGVEELERKGVVRRCGKVGRPIRWVLGSWPDPDDRHGGASADRPTDPAAGPKAPGPRAGKAGSRAWDPWEGQDEAQLERDAATHLANHHEGAP